VINSFPLTAGILQAHTLLTGDNNISRSLSAS